jgi:hypothetical protein
LKRLFPVDRPAGLYVLYREPDMFRIYTDIHGYIPDMLRICPGYATEVA